MLGRRSSRAIDGVSGRVENVSGESGGMEGLVAAEVVVVVRLRVQLLWAEQAGKVKQFVSFNSGTARGSASRKGAGTRSGHRLEW